MAKRLSIDDMHKLAAINGGKCLSETYVNRNVKLLWECSDGHQWEATSDNIKNNGAWCPKCARKRQADKNRLTIDVFKAFAESKGGRCLSEVYIDAHTNLLWECGESHQWEAMPYNVKNNSSWCPICNNTGIAEEYCRHCFEALFGKPFPKKKPRWNLGRHGQRLELDGYNEDLKIAFEHQGAHHYEFDGHFVRTQSDFLKRTQADEDKFLNAKNRGVLLIEIPQLNIKSLENSLEQILCELKSVGYSFVDLNKNTIISTFANVMRHKINGLKKLAEARGGKFLSETYAGMLSKSLWECAEGHRWKANPAAVKFGSWCEVVGVCETA